MAKSVKSIVAVRPCGCQLSSHAVVGGFCAEDERTFRHRAEVAGCAVHVMPAGRSENAEFRCRFGEGKGCSRASSQT